MSEHHQYERRGLRMPWGMAGLLWGTFALFAAWAVYSWVGETTPFYLLLVALLLISPLALAPFMRGRITVDEQNLTLTMRPFVHKTIPRRSIISVERIEVNPLHNLRSHGTQGSGNVVFVFGKGPTARVRTAEGNSHLISDPAHELAESLSRPAAR